MVEIPNLELWLAGGGLFILGLLLGFLFTLLRNQKKQNELLNENIRLGMLLETEQLKQHQLTRQLRDTFQQLSAQALRQNNESFLQLAKQNLAQFQMQSKIELEKKEQAFDSIIKPIRDTLEKTQSQIQLMENERKQAYGALHKHLETMAQTQNNLHQETRNLVQAFRRPEVRGQWGELTLKRLAELAGMVEHCDFIEQHSVNDEQGALLRPDMIIKLPAGREIIVDSKTPLDAYLDAVEAQSEKQKQKHLNRHLRHVKQRIKELASKNYWQQFEQSADFVVLFIPGDQFLTAALDLDRNLIEDALKSNVILTTPSSFVALLRAVAFGWRQETLAKNAEKIRILGEEMFERIAGLTDSLSRTGKSLNQSVDNYNKTIATLSSRVLPSARKFNEMGIRSKKTLVETENIDKKARELETESQ